ncbi:MAG TPA: DUF1579 domain-containing protein, partial [Magnetospirillum sp.]|nr:DUF1579 domain-containing protein [Magnetospirillum sp.]
VGAWSFEGEGGAGEGEGGAGEGQPAQKFTGTETVRGMGGLWVVAEGEGAMPDGGTMTSLMTLGYDPQQGAYVGTFVASMMTHLWVYRGAVDDDGRRLVLCTEGPDMENGGKGMTAFEDSIAIEDPDHRTLTSRMRGADGQWRQVFKARYTRLPG